MRRSGPAGSEKRRGEGRGERLMQTRTCLALVSAIALCGAWVTAGASSFLIVDEDFSGPSDPMIRECLADIFHPIEHIVRQGDPNRDHLPMLHEARKLLEKCISDTETASPEHVEQEETA